MSIMKDRYYKIFISDTDEKLDELHKSLLNNGYNCVDTWVGNCIEVDENELYELITILKDKDINYKSI